jgi:hypothetical protein
MAGLLNAALAKAKEFLGKHAKTAEKVFGVLKAASVVPVVGQIAAGVGKVGQYLLDSVKNDEKLATQLAQVLGDYEFCVTESLKAIAAHTSKKADLYGELKAYLESFNAWSQKLDAAKPDSVSRACAASLSSHLLCRRPLSRSLNLWNGKPKGCATSFRSRHSLPFSIRSRRSRPLAVKCIKDSTDWRRKWRSWLLTSIKLPLVSTIGQD